MTINRKIKIGYLIFISIQPIPDLSCKFDYCCSKICRRKKNNMYKARNTSRNLPVTPSSARCLLTNRRWFVTSKCCGQCQASLEVFQNDSLALTDKLVILSVILILWHACIMLEKDQIYSLPHVSLLFIVKPLITSIVFNRRDIDINLRRHYS